MTSLNYPPKGPYLGISGAEIFTGTTEILARSAVKIPTGRMVAAEYLDYSPENETYILPPEHAHRFASEDTDHYAGGLFHGMPGLLNAAPAVADTLRTGDGFSFRDLHPAAHESVDIMNRGF